MDTYKSVGVRIKSRDLQKIEAEGKALELTRTAYLRMLIDRGREKIGADFAKAEIAQLKDELAVIYDVLNVLKAAPQPAQAQAGTGEIPESVKSAIHVILACSVELRAVDRYLIGRAHGGEEALKEIQRKLPGTLEKWATMLGLKSEQ